MDSDVCRWCCFKGQVGDGEGGFAVFGGGVVVGGLGKETIKVAERTASEYFMNLMYLRKKNKYDNKGNKV